MRYSWLSPRQSLRKGLRGGWFIWKVSKQTDQGRGSWQSEVGKEICPSERWRPGHLSATSVPHWLRVAS